jgi:predicted acetyltransferase
MDIEIRPITEDERVDWVRAAETSFSSILKDDELEAFLPVVETDRSFGAFDGGRIVGSAAGCSFRTSVPGGARIPTAGVTAVGVHPTHRRRGINTALMGAILDQAAERREPFALLLASEAAIYGRFGYGLTSLLGEFEAESARMEFVKGAPSGGHVELISKDEAMPIVDVVYDAAIGPGGVERDLSWRDYSFATVGEDKDKPWFYAIHRSEEGEPDAYAVYTMKHEWPRSVPSGKITVSECVASTASGYAGIWRYLFDVDLVATVETWNRPVDEPLLHLLREPRRLHFTVNDGFWLRVVDVVAALEARRYRADGRLVFEISDAFRPETSGRYELTVEGGAGRCVRTDDPADLAGAINVLGATYLGGATFHQLALAGQVEERTTGAVARADTIFASTPAPWSPFHF